MTMPTTWNLPHRHIGQRVLVYEQLESTNTEAGNRADDVANDGLVVVADSQTAGRGQHGRVWQSPPGASVLLSVLLFPPPPLRRPPVLTAWAAVAVCRTVEQLTGVPPQLKWPNDVLVDNRKVCGILIEQGRGTVIGIGLNVGQSAGDFAAAGLPWATSLAQLGSTMPSHEVARQLLHHLDAEWGRLLGGELLSLETIWKNSFGLLGRSVQVVNGEEKLMGRLASLSFDVLVIERDGDSRHLRPEQVRQLTGATAVPNL